MEEQKLFGDEGDDGAGVLGTSQLLPPIRLQLLSESGGTQGGYQLRVMELNLELEQEIEMNVRASAASPLPRGTHAPALPLSLSLARSPALTFPHSPPCSSSLPLILEVRRRRHD